jgi:alkanesulfonate monooxygenase SsuD/methylene tetrahydromethanopterin reductase-like flavin-dependent oxidoreductase (luciferase family)
VLGVQVAQVDSLSGGRVELGIGAGSDEVEHRAYGIPFPPDRNARLEEQLRVLHILWRLPAGSTHTVTGTHYELVDCPSPRPAQGEIPVTIGGLEAPRAAVLAADFAHESNAPHTSLAETTAQFEYVRSIAHYRRDLVYSATITICVGKNDAEVARRADAIGREVRELKADGVAGTPAEAADTLAQYAEAGATRVYLQILHPLGPRSPRPHRLGGALAAH